ncbi:MAG: nucleoside triphosphate pyrophosphohydrolase [Candidatus Schekmanbacteria bacterium]|nr:nucleoside triphosphate pyrophosphohydrolase [Candidatus Schekmanbacteria bacterium]
MKTFQDLTDIVAKLRGPDGCPWDKQQTHQSLKPFLIEEAYEVLDALDETDPAKLKEELGDLLFQVVLHAQLAKEAGNFTIDEVIETVAEKMTRRHPHVFGDANLTTPQEVLINWEQIKKEEKGGSKTSVLEGVPRQLPSLLRAHRLQEKAARLGFDHPTVDDAFAKVQEEIGEFEVAFRQGNAREMEEELGDLLFTLVNMARFLEVNPEDALGKTIVKFISRFRYIEEKMAERGRPFNEATLEEMDALWEEAKTVLSGNK